MSATPAANAAPSNTLASAAEAHGFRRKMVGRVVSDKMDKTIVVEVVSRTRDQLYGKYAHDEQNQFKVGDEVEIQENRPISRHKRFIVTRLVKKFIQE